MTNFWRKIAIGVLVAATVGVGVAVAAIPRSDDALAPTPDQGRRQSHHVPPLADLVAAFRHEQGSADRIPGEPVKAVRAFGEGKRGENPADARRLDVAGPGSAFVWPMRHGVCYSWTGVAGCAPTNLLERDGAIVGYGRRGASRQWTVFVLVRDGVTNLKIIQADRTSRTYRVNDNAVGASLPAAPVAIRITSPHGQKQVVRLPGA